MTYLVLSHFLHDSELIPIYSIRSVMLRQSYVGLCTATNPYSHVTAMNNAITKYVFGACVTTPRNFEL